MRRATWSAVALAALAAAVAAGLLSFGTRASADAPPQIPVVFTTQHGHPVAGRSFSGLAVTNISGLQNAVVQTSVKCDAAIAGKRLRARKTVFGIVRPGQVQTTVCSWHIPVGTAGKRLENRTIVYEGTGTIESGRLSWTVKSR